MKRPNVTGSSGGADPADIISTEEQDKIIASLRADANEQSLTARKAFQMLFLLIAALFVACVLYSAQFPWEIDHQRHFKDLVPHWAFQAYYCVSAFCFFVAGQLVRDPTHSALLQTARYTGYAMGVVVFLGWTHIFFKHSVTNPVLFWLPVVDLLGLLLAQHVDVDNLTLVQEVETLEKCKYEHKSV